MLLPSVSSPGVRPRLGNPLDHRQVSSASPSRVLRWQRRRRERPVGGQFEHRFRLLSAGFAVPVFAFFSAGVALGNESLLDALSDPIALGIIAGLLLGKPIILGTTWLTIKLSSANLGTGCVGSTCSAFRPSPASVLKPVSPRRRTDLRRRADGPAPRQTRHPRHRPPPPSGRITPRAAQPPKVRSAPSTSRGGRTATSRALRSATTIEATTTGTHRIGCVTAPSGGG